MEDWRRRLREQLACIEHDQWIAWSRSLAEEEQLSGERLERWQRQWVPYAELAEDAREDDRRWADGVLELLEAEGLLPGKKWKP